MSWNHGCCHADQSIMFGSEMFVVNGGAETCLHALYCRTPRWSLEDPLSRLLEFGCVIDTTKAHRSNFVWLSTLMFLGTLVSWYHFDMKVGTQHSCLVAQGQVFMQRYLRTGRPRCWVVWQCNEEYLDTETGRVARISCSLIHSWISGSSRLSA